MGGAAAAVLGDVACAEGGPVVAVGLVAGGMDGAVVDALAVVEVVDGAVVVVVPLSVGFAVLAFVCFAAVVVVAREPDGEPDEQAAARTPRARIVKVTGASRSLRVWKPNGGAPVPDRAAPFRITTRSPPA